MTLENRWATDPRCSHGFVVPLFAAVVLWVRRDSFPSEPWGVRPWGLAVLAAAALVRLGGAYVHLAWFDGASLLLSLVGVGALAGGWKLLRWAWPGYATLFFVLPLPYQVESALAAPLQRMATVAATYALQTLGYPAVAAGNVILIDDQRLGVEDACNGLGMLSVFFALSTAVALVVRRPWYEKVIVFLSAVPTGLAVNLVRITATGWAYQTFGSEVAKVLFHDYAGWLMMPLALAILGLELALLRRLVVKRKVAGPVPVAGRLDSAQITAPASPDRAGARIRHLPQPPPVAADGPGQSGR